MIWETSMREGAIINQISDSTKKKIQDQIEWLGNLSEDKARYQYMLDGAETVLNIISNDKISDVGTINWLSKLDSTQLAFAQEHIALLLNEMEKAQKIKIWCVYSEYSTPYYFRTYEEATSKLKEIVDVDVAEKTNKKNKFQLTTEFVRENELSEYLA